MNKLTLKTSWEQYVTPEMKSIEIKTEGMLCISGADKPDNGYDPDNDLGEI